MTQSTPCCGARRTRPADIRAAQLSGRAPRSRQKHPTRSRPSPMIARSRIDRGTQRDVVTASSMPDGWCTSHHVGRRGVSASEYARVGQRALTNPNAPPRTRSSSWQPSTSPATRLTSHRRPPTASSWSTSGPSGAARARRSARSSKRRRRENPDITFAKIDTEAQHAIAGALEIRSIPTLMIFRDGIQLFSQPGALPGHALDDLIGRVKAIDMDEVRAEIARQGLDEELIDAETTAAPVPVLRLGRRSVARPDRLRDSALAQPRFCCLRIRRTGWL